MKKLINIALGIALALALSVITFASSSNVVSVELLHPANQIDDSGYFNLKMEPSQKQTLKLLVENKSEENRDLEIKVLNSTTSGAGEIGYNEEDKEGLQLRNIASTPQPAITLDANSSVIIEVNIEMPAEEYDGVILGAVMVSDVTDKSETENSGMFSNVYDYIYAISLTENDNPVAANLVLNGVSWEDINTHPGISVYISNSSPVLLKDALLKSEIFKGDTSIYTETSNITFAPSSEMRYGIIPKNPEDLEPGDYKYVATLTADDTTKIQEKIFVVPAKAVLEETVNDSISTNEKQQEKGNPKLFIGIISLAIALIVLGFIIVVLKKRRKG